MCRVLSYLGRPILLDELLYKADNSLITQSYHPKLVQLLNLAGFGFAAWNRHSIQPEIPFLYKIPSLPFYDKNLKNISIKINADCIIAHVRGVEYSEKSIVSSQNAHPFKFDNSLIAFAHNGTLYGYEDMRFDILHYIKSEFRKKIQGTTDTELMYALFLSQIKTKEDEIKIVDVFSALIDTLMLLKKIRKKNHISISSPLNFFISNGEFIVATRFVFDYGHYPSLTYTSAHMVYHSLWYTLGEEYGEYDGHQMKVSKKMQSIIISSEPLTADSTTWIEVPEYSFIGATMRNNQMVVESMDILV